MKKMTIGALSLLFLAASCVKDNVCCTGSGSAGPKLITPQIDVRIDDPLSSQSPLTGILEIYPCHPGGSVYFGNYVNGHIAPFHGFYTIVDGHIHGSSNRELNLPMGTYNMIYWGTPKYEEPIYSSPAIEVPGMSVGADLSQLYYSLRANADTTYRPVYDLVYARSEVKIGEEDLKASLKRAVAGIKVTVKKKNNGIFSSNVTRMEVRIGGIAEKINSYTARPENMNKTVKFELARSVDGTEMSNATVMLFPSSPKPLLELLISLKDGSVHKLSRRLDSTLSANTKLTLNIVIGDILSGGSAGDFSIENWNEISETIEFPMVD